MSEKVKSFYLKSLYNIIYTFAFKTTMWQQFFTKKVSVTKYFLM